MPAKQADDAAMDAVKIHPEQLPSRPKQPSRGGRVTVLIVGTGAFAQGFARRAQKTGAAPYTFHMVLGSRRLDVCSEPEYLPGMPDVPIVPLSQGIIAAHLIIMALPARALKSFVDNYGALLNEKVIIDVSNPMPKDLEQLIDLSPSVRSSLSRIPVAPDVTMTPRSDGRDSSLPNYMGLHFSITYSGGYPVPIVALACVCLQLAFVHPDAGKDIDVQIKDVAEGWEHRAGSTDMQPASVAAWLQQEVTPFGAVVVKAFNSLSAYALSHGDPMTDNMQTVIASDNPVAAGEVAILSLSMGITPRTVPSIKYTKVMETWHHSLMKSWQWPTAVMFIVWVLAYLYTCLRYLYFDSISAHQAIMFTLNKSIAWTSLWGLFLTYCPGVLVMITTLVTRQPQLVLWTWFRGWMDGRKQLGLLSFTAMLLHLFLSAFQWLPAYHARLFDTDAEVVASLPGSELDRFGLIKQAHSSTAASLLLSNQGVVQSVPGSSFTLQTANVVSIHSFLNGYGQSIIVTGIVAGGLMCVTAISSLPSVTPKLNWREWRLLQPCFGWWGLALATLHTILPALVPAWSEDDITWPWKTSTITAVSISPVLVLILLKLLMMTPPVPGFLSRIRRGTYKACNLKAVYC